MTPTARRRALLLAVATALAAPPVARAQDPRAFPSRPVRLLVGAPPGAAPDVAARLMGDRLSALWRQPVVVDNRPAGNGGLAAQAAAGAEADGHALLFAHASLLVLNEALLRAPGFDAGRDFAPVALLMTTPFLIAGRPGPPAASLAELLALARARPGRVTFATSSGTNLPRFAGELLCRAAGVEMLNVAYAAVPAAVQDTIAGRTDAMLDGTPVLAPQVRAGTMRALAVTSPGRFPGLEEVPAVAETLPGFASVGWFGMMAPRATPAAVVARLAADLRGVLDEPGLRARLLRDFGAEAQPEGPEAFGALLARERARYRGLVRELGVALD